MKTLRFGLLLVSLPVFGLAACGDDDSGHSAGDAAVDSGASGQGGSGGKDVGNTGGKDAGESKDAGDGIPADKPVTFKVPKNGGTTKVTLASGNEVSFTFPKSVAGKQITLTPTTASSIGWPKDAFSDVIRMEPDGLEFADAVIIKPSSKDMLLATFADAKKRSAGEMLELTEKAEGLALHHFSVLAIVAPAFSCGNQTGWLATPASQRCADAGTATTFLSFSCDANPLCWSITASCCAAPGSTACHLGDPKLSLSFTWQGPINDMFPWCGPVVVQDSGVDAGRDASIDEDDAGQGTGGTNGGTGGTQGGTGGTQGGTGGTQGGTGGTQGGTGGTQGGTGGTQGGTGGTQGGTGGTQGGTGGTQGGTGGTQGGTGGTQGGTGGTGTIDGGVSGVACDDAGTWVSATSVQNAEQLFGVWGATDTNVWVVGNATAAGALIGHYDGLNWTSEQPAALSAQGQAFRAVWGADATHVFAVGSGGAIYSNATGSWQAITSPTSADLYGIWGVDANNYWVVGAAGAAFQWSAGSWHDYTIATSGTDSIGKLSSIWGTAIGDVWVTNETGVSSGIDYVIHHYFSASWHTDLSSNSSYYWRSVWGTTNSDIWAVGYNKGTSAHYAGSSWVGSSAPAGSPYLNAVWGRATDSVWAVGDGGKIDYWDGMQWTACSPFTNFGLNGLYGTATKVWAVGNAGSVFRND